MSESKKKENKEEEEEEEEKKKKKKKKIKVMNDILCLNQTQIDVILQCIIEKYLLVK